MGAKIMLRMTRVSKTSRKKEIFHAFFFTYFKEVDALCVSLLVADISFGLISFNPPNYEL